MVESNAAPGPTPDPLTAYLATHDAPCPGCKYNLRGIQQPQCPECGRVLTLEELLAPSLRSINAMADVVSFLMAFPFIVVATLICIFGIDLGPSRMWLPLAAAALISATIAWAFLFPIRRLLRKRLHMAVLYNPVTVLILIYLLLLVVVLVFN